MYPYDIISAGTFHIGIYDVCIAFAFVAALVVCDRYLTARKIPNKVINFYLLTGVAAILLGLFSAELVQSFFNYLKSGIFKLEGMTFYGGLIGGVIVFFIIFFAVGKLLFKEKEHLTYFKDLFEVAPCSIAIAHAIGRIGCLFAGCCYGLETGGFPGIRMTVEKAGTSYNGFFLPTQLYEAVFLAILFFIMTLTYNKKYDVNFIVYLISYGVWRFSIEFLRSDDRGYFIPGLTPAQAISILFVAVGTALLIYKIVKDRKKSIIEQEKS